MIEWEKPTVEQSIRLGYEAFAPEEDKPEPSNLDIAAATLRTENPVASWMEGLNYRSEQEDVTGFNPYDQLDEKYLPYSEEFNDVRSPEQLYMKQAQIDSELRDREIMAQGGMKSIGWSLVAGLGDPINLPLMLLPPARIGAGALETAASVGAVGAVSAAVSEYALHQTQAVRTWEESLYAIGATALLGGAMGGLAGAGSKQTSKILDAVEADIRDIKENGPQVNLDTVGTAGAARVVGTLAEEGSDMLGPGINPLIRLLKSPATSARNTVNRMLRHNFYTGKNKTEVTMPDGTVKVEHVANDMPVEVSIVRTQQGLSAKYLRTLEENYKALRKRGVKMSRSEFRKQVGRAMRRGDAHELDEIAASARKIRGDVIAPITRGFQELGDLPEDLTSKFAESYLPRVYDVKNIKKNMDKWLEMLTVHFTGKDTSALEARALAADITDKILSAPNGRMPLDIVGSTGRLKARTLNIRDEVLDEAGFLVDNVDDVMQTYLRSTAPELHLKQEFGDHELTQPFQSIKDEYEIKIDAAKTNKERKALTAQRDKDIADLAAMRDIMLGRYLRPTDHAKGLANMGRVVRGLSFMANLGMMTISAMPDIAGPIMQHGAKAWAKALPRAMLYWAKETRLARKSLEEMGIGVDTLLNSRAYALSDIDDVGTGLEKFTRTFAKYSGMNHWNSTMKKVAAFTAQNRFIEDSINYAKLPAKRKAALAKAGIDGSNAKIIAEQAQKHGKKLATSWDANTIEWTDRAAAELFEKVLLKDVDSVIVTPGHGDRPIFMSTEMGKTILQFKTFFLAAHNSWFLPRVQQLARGDVAALEGILTGMSLGMMSEWTRLQLSGREDEMKNYSMQDWVRAGLDRSGIVSVPMELFNMGDRFLDGRLSQQMGLMQGSRYFYRNWAGTLMGPTFGYASDIGSLLQNLVNSDGLSARDIHALRRLMPYQNMFYLRQLINHLEDEVVDATGAEKRKRRRGKSGSKYIQ